MKIITFYLPQFHDIPENDEWWGKGFTEWHNVKKARPLFEGHQQPRVPLNHNYYNLLDDETKIWQSELAQKYGIYGFCYYHYWFSGKLLLERPMEQMLRNKKITIPFCICWANEPWTKAWVGESKILIAQKYGGRDEWEAHFNYLLPFFKDERYIYENEKPLVVIYRPHIIPCLNEMLDCWDELARKNGLKGITFASQHIWDNKEADDSRFTYHIESQPLFALKDINEGKYSFLKKMRNTVSNTLEQITGKNLRQLGIGMLAGNRIEYDTVWEVIVNKTPESEKSIPGAFVEWDNTPRRGKGGKIFMDASPDKFRRYLSRQIDRAKMVYHKDMIFMFAWNEWCEGGYLEPDERYGYQYLEAVRDALAENDELPEHSGMETDKEQQGMEDHPL